MTNRAVDNQLPPGMSPYAYCSVNNPGYVFINGPNADYTMLSLQAAGPWLGTLNISAPANLTNTIGSRATVLTCGVTGTSGVANELAIYADRYDTGTGGDEWYQSGFGIGFGHASSFITGLYLLQLSGQPTMLVYGDVIPDADGTRNLGTAARGWENVYCDTVVDTSDARLKRDVVDMDKDAATAFVRSLTSVTGRWKKPKHVMVPDPALAGKTMPAEVEDTTRHNWFIAQNVRDSLRLVNVGEGQAIAKGILLHEEVDGKERLGLSYKEFTPILCAALQKALDRIDSLEARISLLESK